MKKIGLIGTGAAAIVLLAAASHFALHAAPSTSTAAAAASLASAKLRQVVRRQPLAGQIVSTSEAAVAYAGQPATVSSVAVHTGENVSAGETLATLSNNAVLTAPFSGTVVSVSLNAGSVVPSNTADTSATNPSSGMSSAYGGRYGSASPSAGASPQVIAAAGSASSITLANINTIAVDASVSELDVHWLHPGQSVSLSLPGEPGILYHGKILTIDQQANSSSNSSGSVTYPVTISCPVPAHTPTPWLGMSVQAYVTVARQLGVTVPLTALHQNAQGKYYVILSSGQHRTVSLGLVGIHYAVIRHGLASGTAVQVPPSANPRKKVTVMVEPFAGFSRSAAAFSNA
ncbi:MAG: HlyD family efflux transporter periplasmic adaptor subunit [Firmicutes bacterium]|nr:HlyD family efflux transporter periplasmic adaptor subunit [Bacillota bacterium]